MLKKLNFRFALCCIMVFMIAAAVSCAKKTSDPDQEMPDRDREVSESESAEAERQRAEEKEDTEIDEQELEAEERAEKRTRREDTEEEEKEEEEKEQFLSEKVYFDFDDASLSAEARDTLQQKVSWLRENPDACVIIEGHCDERGTDEYNLALGSRRAESVKDFLVKAGIEGTRLTTISYGEERPAVKGQDEEAWAKNRRAEFRFCR
ncbi:MAG: peptidoglycan-associated lipoprotein Pal [Desulfosalsimonas sp.]